MVNDPSLIQTRAQWTAGLQALRDRAGLSYVQLSERCEGTSTSTLQKMVTGESFPRAATVRLFVRACGERDAQPWADARNRVQAAEATLQRRRTSPGKQIWIGTVPPRADCFQVREVATRLEQAAEEHGTVVLTQVLAGLGGVGKTQLAAAYARRAWQQGVGVLVWAAASSRDGIISAYAAAALRLGLPLADRDDPEQAAREFLAWAETTTDRWWLVVLDDVQRPGDVKGLWPSSAASAAGGEVVVTTRRREAALSTSDRHTISIATFTLAEARSYLGAKLAGRDTCTAEAEALAEELGYLPLALAQAATYILNEDIDCAEYRRRLARHLMTRVLPPEEDLPGDHQHIINATWELSIDQADRAAPTGLARPVLYLASVLDPAGVPQAVLESPPALDYLTSYLPDPARDEEVSPETVDAAIRVLHRYSLLDHDRAAAHREVRVHQVVQRATRENLASQPDAGPEMYAALAGTAADALLAVWPDPEQEELSQILRANTTALARVSGSALWDSGSGIPGVLFRAANSLFRTGQYTAAIDAYTDLHASAAELLGTDHPDLFVVRSNLAGCRGQAGDAVGAATAYQELVTDMFRTLGPNYSHTLTVAAAGNFAYWWGMAGEPATAVSALEEMLPHVTRVLGPDHYGTLIMRSNLARWRGEAGDAAGAVAATEEVLADMERVLGPDHHDTLIARGNLARWKGEVSDATGAASIEELPGDMERVLGPDHPETLIARSSVAFWRGMTGDAARAAAAFNGLLVDMERVLGADHQRTIATRRNLKYWREQADLE